MEILQTLLELILIQPALASLLIGIFTVKETILVLSFLSGQGMISPITVLIFATIGAIISDLFFFTIGKLNLTSRLQRWKKFSMAYGKIDGVVGKLTHENHIMILLYSKFIYGTRLITLIYLGMRKTSYKEFLIYNSAITLLWSLIMIPLGYLAGKGFIIILGIFKSIQLASTFVVLFIIILLLTKNKINKKVIEKKFK